MALDPEALGLGTHLQSKASELPSSQCILWGSKSLPGVGSIFPSLNLPCLGPWTPFTGARHALGTSARSPAATHPLRKPQAQPLGSLPSPCPRTPSSLAQLLGALDRSAQVTAQRLLILSWHLRGEPCCWAPMYRKTRFGDVTWLEALPGWVKVDVSGLSSRGKRRPSSRVARQNSVPVRLEFQVTMSCFLV